MGADLFHSHRLLEVLPAGSGPTAACMGPGHNAHFLPAVFFGGFPLKDNGAVQVFAALRGQPDALLGQHRGNARIYSLRGFDTGILADAAAHDLTGRAAHHEYIAFFQFCLCQQFGHGLPGFGLDLFFEFFGHKNTSFIHLQMAGAGRPPSRNTLCFPPGTLPSRCPLSGQRTPSSSCRPAALPLRHRGFRSAD